MRYGLVLFENKRFKGLIRVTMKKPSGKKESLSFLKNYTGQAHLTAASILKTLKSYRRLPSKEVPPNQSWTQNRLQIAGVNEKPLNIFVGGHKAQYQGNNTWRYWYHPNKTAFLTVIKKGFIVHRRLIHVRQFVNIAVTNDLNRRFL